MYIKAECGIDIYHIIITSQWLKTSCGLANPLVLLRISSANPKLSATGRTALMMNMSVPSFISSWRTRPSLFPRTPYTRPGIGRDRRFSVRLFSGNHFPGEHIFKKNSTIQKEVSFLKLAKSSKVF